MDQVLEFRPTDPRLKREAVSRPLCFGWRGFGVGFVALLAMALSLARALADMPLADAPAPVAVSAAQPHVTASLLLGDAAWRAGKPLPVALHLQMDAGWHTYWQNPGDAGFATRIRWVLPPGTSAGPIEWPTPELLKMGPIVTYGYSGDVYLLTTLTMPAGSSVNPGEITAEISWLVCQEECIPGKATLHFRLPVGAPGSGPAANDPFFAAARARLPAPNQAWDVTAAYSATAPGDSAAPSLTLVLKNRLNAGGGGLVSAPDPHGAYFFPNQPNVLDPLEPNAMTGDARSGWSLVLPLHQNGETPDHLGGVLAGNNSSAQGFGAIDLGEFAIAPAPVAATISAASAAAAAPAGTASTVAVSSAPGFHAVTPGGTSAPVAPSHLLLLVATLGAAFLGGLILNLMPCVLPVLSLKVFALMHHAKDQSMAWRQGAAFSLGVVVSFWILAGLLLALRASGHLLGWGFQMQSPGFVLGLTLLFFLLALNLFGIFSLGEALVGLDARATARTPGLGGSFLNGVLATIAATPCTGPFMGSAIGFAAQQSAPEALLVFTALALGLAAPYFLLTLFPAALRWVPRPGAWMEGLRQFLGFLLLGTVVWLVSVLGSLLGFDRLPLVLAWLLLAGFAIWIYGRTARAETRAASRWGGAVAALLLGGAVIWVATRLADLPPTAVGEAAAGTEGNWQPFSPAAVTAGLRAHRPVFVDFTAAWCLSCKVNEAVALDVASVRQAFAAKHVVLLRADWTHADPQISATLRHFQRDGVPLYLLYRPQDPDDPQTLPEVLTPGIVRQALDSL